MLYGNELDFLRATFKKAHLNTKIAMLTDSVEAILDGDVDAVFGINAPRDMTVQKCLGVLEEKTVYKSTDKFKLCYIYFILPSEATPKVLFIGPIFPHRFRTSR